MSNEKEKKEQETYTEDYLREKHDGIKIEDNQLEGQEGAGRQGDKIINGIKVELKRLNFNKDLSRPPNAKTIKGRVNDSLRREGQARHILLDARGSGLTEQDAVNGIDLSLQPTVSRGKLDSVRVIGDNFDRTGIVEGSETLPPYGSFKKDN